MLKENTGGAASHVRHDRRTLSCLRHVAYPWARANAYGPRGLHLPFPMLVQVNRARVAEHQKMTDGRATLTRLAAELESPASSPLPESVGRNHRPPAFQP
jgi:hypothetical protein